MKLAFSTIGCPDWSFDEIVAAATDLRYDAIEIRGVKHEMFAPAIKQLQDTDKLIKRFALLNLSISCLTSGATFAIHENKDKSMAEAKAYVDLAKKLHVPYVRIMSTDKPYYDGGDINLCKAMFSELVKYAEGTGVTPLMETNGLFVDTKKLRDFLEETGGGALWDVHHPYRFGGEAIEESADNLNGFIKDVHLKDSVVNNGKTSYRIIGYGDIPIEKAINELKNMGYDGYLTMEWVKLWNKELDEPGVVFAHYPFFMKRLIG